MSGAATGPNKIACKTTVSDPDVTEGQRGDTMHTDREVDPRSGASLFEAVDIAYDAHPDRVAA